MDFAQWLVNFREENKDIDDIQTFIDKLQTAPPRELDENEVEGYLSSDKGKQQLQSKLDQYATKALNSFKEKSYKTDVENAVQAKIKELYPDETPESIKYKELEAKFDAMKKENLLKEQTNIALQYATENKLPADLVKFFIGEEDDQTKGNLDALKSAIDPYVQAAVDERFQQSGTNLHQNQATPTMSLDQFASQSLEDINANWEQFTQNK